MNDRIAQWAFTLTGLAIISMVILRAPEWALVPPVVFMVAIVVYTLGRS